MSDGNTEKNRRIREKPTQRRKQSLLATCSREMCAACAVCLPTVEVHLSNMHRRESFRARTFSSRGVDGVIRGLGALSYTLALHALAGILATHAEGNCNV